MNEKNSVGVLSLMALALGLLGAFGILMLPGYLIYRLIKWMIDI